MRNYENQIKACIKRSTHGMSKTRLYRIWSGIITRCTNQNSKGYKNYGGRGISICETWKTFENFMNWSTQNGYQENLSIDRINNNGNYEPNNCRWSDRITQNRNQRSNILITAFNETKTATEWSKQYNIRLGTILDRINLLGWDSEKAVSTPPRKLTKGGNKAIYKRYRGILNRCYDKNTINYERYGAKGILMCDEWKNSFDKFKQWCLNNGWNPMLELDRIDTTKGYSPDNCRFVTKIQNIKNKKKCI